MDESSELRLELKREFTDFLDQDFGRETGEGKYVRRVGDIVKHYTQAKRVRLEVDLQGEGRGREAAMITASRAAGPAPACRAREGGRVRSPGAAQVIGGPRPPRAQTCKSTMRSSTVGRCPGRGTACRRSRRRWRR